MVRNLQSVTAVGRWKGWVPVECADRLLDQRGGCRVVALKIGATWAGAEWIGSALVAWSCAADLCIENLLTQVIRFFLPAERFSIHCPVSVEGSNGVGFRPTGIAATNSAEYNRPEVDSYWRCS